MNKSAIKLDTLRQMEEMVQAHLDRISPAMDDYDGGQIAALNKVLNDISAFRAIIKHTNNFAQQQPGVDY